MILEWESTMDLSTFIGIIMVLIILGVSIIIGRRQTKTRIKEIEKFYSDLGFVENESPDPGHINQLSSLRKGTKPVALLVKRIQNGYMYVYQLIFDRSEIPHAVTLYDTVAVISSNLRLPRFTVSPVPQGMNHIKPSSMEEFDKSDEFTTLNLRVENIQLGIDEEYENTHLIQSSDKNEVLFFLTSKRIRELRNITIPYEIRCNGSCFSIDLPMWKRPGKDYLKHAVKDAEIIYRILSG
jgi:hypothetical protein